MNKFFKKTTLAALLISGLAFAGSASATKSCFGKCDDEPPVITPPTQTVPSLNFQANAGATFGGLGAGFVNPGSLGAVESFHDGYAQTETAFGVEGSMCGVDCLTGTNFSATGASGQQTLVNAWASGRHVLSGTSGTANSGVTFNFKKQ